MSDFVMPALGADMESAKLVEWRVTPGDRVKKGDIIAVVETHKGAIEIEVFEDGVIRELLVPIGETALVGTVLARIDGEGAAGAQPRAPAAVAAAKPAPSAAKSPAASTAPRPAPAAGARAHVSPAARRRAAELGVDLARLTGSGPDQSVTFADVEAAGARQFQAAPSPRRSGFDPDEMRRAIGAAMSRSKREIPHYYLGATIDLGRALSWLDAFNATRPPRERLLPAVLLLKAVAVALKSTPQLNGFWENDQFRAGSGIHVGWAIALRGGGLIAPALHDADTTPLPELMRRLGDLVARARNGGLRGSELSDPTITVSSLGDRGADTLLPVIYPPQVAIVGFGRIMARPMVVEARVEPRPSIAVSLAADHRASDGHLGGQFLAEVEHRLQQPESL